MVIVTFGQKGLINHKYFVCKDSQTSADYKVGGKKVYVFEIILKALHLVYLPFP